MKKLKSFSLEINKYYGLSSKGEGALHEWKEEIFNKRNIKEPSKLFADYMYNLLESLYKLSKIFR